MLNPMDKKTVIVHLLRMVIDYLEGNLTAVEVEKTTVKEIAGIDITDERLLEVSESRSAEDIEELIDSWLPSEAAAVTTNDVYRCPVDSSDMKDFREAIEHIVKFAEGIHDECLLSAGKGKDLAAFRTAIRAYQTKILEYTKMIGLPALCRRVVEAHPEYRAEMQRRVLAATGEGKRLEDSLIR